MIHWNAACSYKQQALAQIVLQATLHTIFEICHPILLFGTILLLNLCDLPPYTLIWHYTFIRHTRVVNEVRSQNIATQSNAGSFYRNLFICSQFPREFFYLQSVPTRSLSTLVG